MKEPRVRRASRSCLEGILAAHSPKDAEGIALRDSKAEACDIFTMDQAVIGKGPSSLDLGRHAVECYNRNRQKIEAMQDDEVDHGMFGLLLSADAVRDEMQVYEEHRSQLMQLAHTGYYVRKIQRLHAVLDAMTAQYGLSESSELDDWRFVLNQERLERVERYNTLLASYSASRHACSDPTELTHPFFSDLENDEQQEEAITLLKASLTNYSEIILLPEEIAVIKRAFTTIAEHANMIVMAAPSWLVMPFEFMSEFGLSRWGNDTYYPEHADFGRFIHDANVWSSLNHPHVAKFLGACHVGSQPFIVHERARSLSECISEMTSREQVWRRVYEVALGLQYLHERGLMCGERLSMESAHCAEFEPKSLLFGAQLLPLENAKQCSPSRSNESTVQRQSTPKQSETDLERLCLLAFASLRKYSTSTSSAETRVRSEVDAVPFDSIPDQRPDFIQEDEWIVLTNMRAIKRNSNVGMFSAIVHLREFTGAQAEYDVFGDAALSYFDDDDGSCRIDSVTIPALGECSVATALQHCSNMVSNCISTEAVLFRLLDLYEQIKLTDVNTTNFVQQKQLIQSFASLVVRFHRYIDQSTRSYVSLQWSLSSLQHKKQDQTSMLSFHLSIDQLITRYSLSRSNKVHKWESERPIVKTKIRAERFSVPMKVPMATSLSMHRLYTDQADRTALEHDENHTFTSPSNITKWFVSPTEIEFRSFDEFSRGAFGSVHHGKWFDTPVVVKNVFLDVGDRDKLYEQFLQEANTWFELNHINVIKMYGACHIGQPFFVCEYASGGDLSSYLREKKKTEDDMYEVWYILLNAALGLQYLHDKGIVHADLKANNVLVGGDGIAKLADFGLSKSGRGYSSRDLNDGGARGAYRWKAPECLPWKGESGQSATFASDVYSFAMVMIEVVSGEVPWGDIHDTVVVFQVKQGKLPPRPVAIADSEWNLIQKMCCFDPRERLTIDSVVVHLSSLLERIDMDRLWSPVDDLANRNQHVNHVVSRGGILLSLIKFMKSSNTRIARLARNHLLAVQIKRSTHADKKEIEAVVNLLACGNDGEKQWAAIALSDLAFHNPVNGVEITLRGGVDLLVALLRVGNEKQKANAVVALLNLADNDITEVDIAMRDSIGPLVGLLREGNDVQKERAAIALGNLARNDTNVKEIVSFGGIGLLVSLIRDGNDQQKVNAVAALWNLAIINENQIEIASCGGIGLLVALLREGNDLQKENAVGALFYLAFNTNNQIEIASCGGIDPLVALVRVGNSMQREKASGVLWNLSTNDENVSLIASSGAIPPLLELVRNGNEHQKENAAAVLWNLSANDGNKMMIVSCGGVDSLVALLRNGNDEQKEKAAGTLWNLAYQSTDRAAAIRECGAVEPLLDLVASGSANNKLWASGVLSFLGPDGITKAKVATHGGIQALLEYAKETSDDDELKEVLIALKEYLCVRHSDSDSSESRVRESFIAASGVDILSQIAENGSSEIQALANRILSELRKRTKTHMQ